MVAVGDRDGAEKGALDGSVDWAENGLGTEDKARAVDDAGDRAGYEGRAGDGYGYGARHLTLNWAWGI